MSVLFLYDLAISGQYHKVAFISVLQSTVTVLGCEHCHKLCSHFYDHGRSSLHFKVAYFMIMAPTFEQKQRMDTLEAVLIQKPEWKCPNVSYIVRGKPIVMINERKHYLIHWENPHYKDEYIDVSYMQRMEDILKLKCNQHPPGELPLSPEQCHLAASRRKEALKRMCKTRASQRTPPQPTPEEMLQAVAQPEEFSPKEWRIVEEDDMLDLNIDPFSEESVQ